MLTKFAYLTKRDGMSVDSFVDYYENHHVPLILGLAPAPLVYQRHYVVRGHEFNTREDEVDFDVVTESGFADRAAYLAWVAAIGAAADRVAADEARFLDRSRTRSVVVEDHVTTGRPPTSRSSRRPS